MSLFTILTAKPGLQTLASKVAPLLGTASFLEGIKRVHTREGVSVFRYEWTQDFDELTDELVKTMTPDVQHAVRTMAGSKIGGTRPPAILFLAKGKLWNPLNETAILLPLPIPMDALREAIPQAANELKELFEIIQIPDDASNEATLQLQSDVNRTNSCGTELPSNSITLVFESVHFEVVPRWVPFLIIRMSTFKKHGD